jgi:hypothetical protein
MESLYETPGAANAFLASMRALSAFARSRDLIDWPLCDGVQPFELEGGYAPWTEAQIEAAHALPPSAFRRGVMLMLYTGQRVSDMVRMGVTMVDGDGFDLGFRGQTKTGVRPWCPILPELAAEMAVWDAKSLIFLGPGCTVVQCCTRFRISFVLFKYRRVPVTVAEFLINDLNGLIAVLTEEKPHFDAIYQAEVDRMIAALDATKLRIRAGGC